MNVSEWLEAGRPWNVILLGDCMDLMAELKPGEIDLAVVDPPYGIGDWTSRVNCYPQKDGSIKRIKKERNKVVWNDAIPEDKYFIELNKISKNQIIWGANYYNCFNSQGGSLVWYKGKINPVFSQCEIASLSFQKRVDYIHINWQAGFFRARQEIIIHECQKPVALYRWILQNYAKPGQTIIDTHSGSGSLACACDLEGFRFIAIEKDPDYHRDSVNRLNEQRSQGKLF